MDIRTTASQQHHSGSAVARWRFLRHAVVATALLTCTAQAPSARATDALSSFSTLTSLKTDVDLPQESSGAAASVNRDLRPALSYPTLHLKGEPAKTDHGPAPISSGPRWARPRPTAPLPQP